MEELHDYRSLANFAAKELTTRDDFGAEVTDRNRPFATPLWAALSAAVATDRKVFVQELAQTVG